MKPTNDDTVEMQRVLALWGHLMDDRELDRLGECLTEDAVWDASPFGLDRAVGLEAITAVLRADGHARAYHTTNIVVSDGPGDEARPVQGPGRHGRRHRHQRRVHGRTAAHR
ncbi:nuclear transport factor 2 family protein [Streptomyces sp. GTA36]|uniref:nuclear transport factor 2 family protein n=1 Tax=Streptomyces umbrinus TaxID=67370 RepID=UPI0033E64D5C